MKIIIEESKKGKELSGDLPIGSFLFFGTLAVLFVPFVFGSGQSRRVRVRNKLWEHQGKMYDRGFRNHYGWKSKNI